MAVRDIKLEPSSHVAKKALSFGLNNAAIVASQTNRKFAHFKPEHEFLLTEAQLAVSGLVGALAFRIVVANRDGIVGAADATLVVDATPDQFAHGAIVAKIGDKVFAQAAQTGLAFSQAFTVADDTFGVSLIQMDASGTVSTKEPSAAMDYATASLAAGNVPAPDAGNIALGYVVIAPTAGLFTANTTALTGIATFTDTPVIAPAVASLAAVDDTLVDSAAASFDAAHGNPDASIIVTYTTDGTGDVTTGSFVLRYRPYPLNGEVSQVTD